jgi:hypothetical protein
LIEKFNLVNRQNLGFAPIRNEDIRRLDVTMGDAFFVSCNQAMPDLNPKVQQFVGRKRRCPRGYPVPQGLAYCMAMKGHPSCSPNS